jgi:sugar fermentation stimulation protein A
MLFPNLTAGKILKRYKRFFVDVELADGSIVVAHCANTGSMKTCWEPGWSVLLSPASNPERKLRWTLEFTLPPGHFIMVNTGLTNHLVKEALSELAPFKDYLTVLPEQKIFDSRFDFKLTQPGLPDFWVEVKNVTLLESAGVASFPDAVSTRGLKHLHDLIKLKESGYRAAMLYVLSRSDAEKFKSADKIDPDYAQALKLAVSKGVEVYCFGLEKKGDEYKLTKPIEVLL